MKGQWVPHPYTEGQCSDLSVRQVCATVVQECAKCPSQTWFEMGTLVILAQTCFALLTGGPEHRCYGHVYVIVIACRLCELFAIEGLYVYIHTYISKAMIRLYWLWSHACVIFIRHVMLFALHTVRNSVQACRTRVPNGPQNYIILNLLGEFILRAPCGGDVIHHRERWFLQPQINITQTSHRGLGSHNPHLK